MAAGSIAGIVQDEQGAPMSGRDRVGARRRRRRSRSPIAADASSCGRCRPGRTWCAPTSRGFVASRGQVVDVRPSARASSSIALRHVNAANVARRPRRGARRPASAAGRPEAPAAPTPDRGAGARGRRRQATATITARWRGGCATRAARFSRTRPSPSDVVGRRHAGDSPTAVRRADVLRPRRSDSSARLASNFFAGTPFSGQVNLLTTGSFDSPQQLFSTDNFARSIAYLALGAPVGEHADWTVRAALTQGDIAVVDRRRRLHDARAGAAPLRHRPVLQQRSATTAATSRRCATSPTAAATPAPSTASTPSRFRRSSR